MIAVNLRYEGFFTQVTLFYISAPKSMLKEIREALKGEVDYNGARYDFGGLKY